MSRYNVSMHDDLVAQQRAINQRLAAVEVPAGASSVFGAISVVPSTEITTPPVLTTSASYQALFRLFFRKRTNNLEVMIYYVTDSTTGGTVRLACIEPPFGGVIGNEVTLPAGSSGYVVLSGSMGDIGTTGISDLQVDVEARRDFGTGNVRVLVAQAYG